MQKAHVLVEKELHNKIKFIALMENKTIEEVAQELIQKGGVEERYLYVLQKIKPNQYVARAVKTELVT